MKHTDFLITFVFSLILAAPAYANLYPVSPPGFTVELHPVHDFIVQVPDTNIANIGMPSCEIIGDLYNNHPGAFCPVGGNGSFFIGTFDHAIGNKLYLWETTSALSTDHSEFYGPMQVSVGITRIMVERST